MFETASVLKFTHEICTVNAINFLDVHIDLTQTYYSTDVYQKPTYSCIYLNANSECLQRYKDGPIKALIHRTYKISHNWQAFDNSINNLKHERPHFNDFSKNFKVMRLNISNS